jgi:integrase/recombinase XerD
MSGTCFSGPLASEFADFATTLEASATANKSTITLLRAIDRVTEECAPPSGTVDEAVARAWLAPCESRGPNTLLSRYYLLRRFCRFVAKRRPDTFIPGESLRPRRRPAAPPYIYSREEIRQLLDSALSLRDWKRSHRHCPIRSKTIHAIILLLATSGLRISEALHLTLQDVDLEQGVLSIHQSKFRKSRLVPLSAGTADVLRQYHELRVAVASTGPDEDFFVSGRGKAYSISTVRSLFRDIAVEVGLREPKGRGPSLHDLRSTFAVTRLLQWYRNGDNVMARLPLLSTYLGHARVSDTEVYLRITTALLEEANARFYAFARSLLPYGGES